MSAVETAVVAGCMALVALTIAVGVPGANYYQDVRYMASREAKRPIVRGLFLGFAIIVIALGTAGFTMAGFMPESLSIGLIVVAGCGFLGYLIIIASVLLGD